MTVKRIGFLTHFRPGVFVAARRNVGGAIYGLILATSVIAVSLEYSSKNAGITAVTVIVTASVFWLAHIYSDVMALEVRDRHLPSRAELGAIVSRQWPLVQAGMLPTFVLLLGPLGVLEDGFAQSAALSICLIELAATGFAASWMAGMRGFPAVASGAVSLSFGLIIVALKTIVH